MRPLLVVMMATLSLATWTRPARAGTPFTLGVATHYARPQNNTPEGRAVAARLGVGSFRTGVDWALTETQTGVFHLPPPVTKAVRSPELATLRPMLTLFNDNKLYSDRPKPQGAV